MTESSRSRKRMKFFFIFVYTHLDLSLMMLSTSNAKGGKRNGRRSRATNIDRAQKLRQKKI